MVNNPKQYIFAEATGRGEATRRDQRRRTKEESRDEEGDDEQRGKKEQEQDEEQAEEQGEPERNPEHGRCVVEIVPSERGKPRIPKETTMSKKGLLLYYAQKREWECIQCRKDARGRIQVSHKYINRRTRGIGSRRKKWRNGEYSKTLSNQKSTKTE